MLRPLVDGSVFDQPPAGVTRTKRGTG